MTARPTPGWQWQDNALSVQQVLEEALARLTGKKTRVTGASRTDAGVHALGQRAHFDTASPHSSRQVSLCAQHAASSRYSRSGGVCGPLPIFMRASMRAGKRYTYRIYNAPHASALHA